MNAEKFARRLPELMHELAGSDDRYVDEVLRKTVTMRQRPAWSFPTRWLPALEGGLPTWSPAYSIVIALTLLALLALLLATALFIGSQPERLSPRSYEAVVLRRVAEGANLHVIAVNPQGEERQVARLQAVRVAPPNEGYLHPPAAISLTGLLAIPNGPADRLHWEIINLHDAAAEPVVAAGIEQNWEQLQDIPYFRLDMRPSVFWGPDDLLAIPWYERIAQGGGLGDLDYHVGFVDGRSGLATTVDVPDELTILPEWTWDGSGVFVTGSLGGPVQERMVLRRDGTLTDEAVASADSTCSTRSTSGIELTLREGRVTQRHPNGDTDELPAPDNVVFACLAPDDSMVVLGTDGYPRLTRLIVPGKDDHYNIEGKFAGWLDVAR